MKKEFYRFRRINSLIGEFEELENQSIYFAEPESLNDPMEGFRDIYWRGDFIVWRNFFRHYLLCLERLCSLLIISGEEHPITTADIPVFSGEEDFPTPMYQKLFVKITNKFFDNESLIKLIKSISQRTTPIRRDELYFYLRNIHIFSLEVIFSEYERSGFIPERDNKKYEADKQIRDLVSQDFIGTLEKSLLEGGGVEKIANEIFSAHHYSNQQMDLIYRFNGNIDSEKRNKNLVFIEFPKEYISQIEKLVFPDWYTACFMTEYKSSSVWGHYGDNHYGACLIFNANVINEESFLSLKARNGYNSTSGPTYGFSNRKFYPIDYIQGYGQIDFFRMLGRLPIPKLNSMWYMLNGSLSECADEMNKSEDIWHENYWNNFYRDITVKSKDWSYENEHRLILASSLDNFSDPKDRSLNYEFSSLKGIIFGIKTTTEDKLKVIKIIEKKCNETGRDDFKFYQAQYSSVEKCITHYEMSLLNFKKGI
ncbi:DUF2971 domain-containing protein [Pseudoalteromonas shioyasakiensis]|uniref:DUF2971 domain-containing protein n=1 Tax=Pseudoalteromonas shioyasakiensis TaxID=1190813 RepID=UPI0021187DFD|nr:DUF2971 domain-containing protein [Pseudoalteromonas shioyasakiensis]MCQ8882706.1 DUF2971 domain-containing protein [Pseudoalteromonas shioyasakiensis]